MNYNSIIHVHFPRPGDWANYSIIAMWEDADGFNCRRAYKPADVPAEHSAAMQSVVETLVNLDAPWQATHVTARLVRIEPSAVEEGDEGQTMFEPFDVVELTLYARRADGATKMFAPEELPALRIYSAEAIAAFKHLTQDNA